MEFAVLASGAMADFKVAELITLAHMAELMQAGSEISNRYTPPNRDEIERMLLNEWGAATILLRFWYSEVAFQRIGR